MRPKDWYTNPAFINARIAIALEKLVDIAVVDPYSLSPGTYEHLLDKWKKRYGE